jgi:hypothetical protein
MLVEHRLLFNGFHILGSPMRLPFAWWMLCWTALKGCHKSSEFKLILSLHLEVGWTHTFIQWISHYGQPYKAAIFMMIVVLDGPWRLSHESSEFKLILSLHLDVGWTHTFIQWISHYGQPYEAAICMMNFVLDSPWRLSYESSTNFVTTCGCWLNIGLRCVS